MAISAYSGRLPVRRPQSLLIRPIRPHSEALKKASETRNKALEALIRPERPLRRPERTLN